MSPDEYRKMAEVEDAMWYYRALHRHVLRAVKSQVSADAAVLDAGCGTGGFLRVARAAQPGWKLAGVDLAPLAVELARVRTGIDVQPGSVTSLPFVDASFDAIVSCDVLCQIEQPAEALAEFKRCLKPGGTLVLTLPAYQWMFSYHDRAVGNLRRYSRGAANGLARAAGLTIMRCTYWNTLPFPLAVVRRKLLPPAAGQSDVQLYPAPVEMGFNGLMALEHAWLGADLPLPVGSSVLTVARK